MCPQGLKEFCVRTGAVPSGLVRFFHWYPGPTSGADECRPSGLESKQLRSTFLAPNQFPTHTLKPHSGGALHRRGQSCALPGLPARLRPARTSREAAKRLSPKWRVTMSSGSRMAVRLMRAFQRSSISMYVDICWSCEGVKTAGSSPACAVRNDKDQGCRRRWSAEERLQQLAMRAVFITADSDCRWAGTHLEKRDQPGARGGLTTAWKRLPARVETQSRRLFD